MSGTSDKAAQKARQFWRRCNRDPAFASLLEDVLVERTTGRALLIATTELFSNWQAAGPHFQQQFQSRGLPYLSHSHRALRRGFEEVATLQGAAMSRTQRSAARLTPDVQTSAGEELRDQLVLATLRTIQKHDGLRGLVNDRAPVAPHGLSTGQRTVLAGIQGNTAANGSQTITVTDATHFTLNGSSGNGNYVGATGTCSGGGMAYYDAYTAQAAQTTLGRSLASFYTQDDDPTVNGSADANFLADLIKSHIDSIRTTVLAAYSSAKFELLWPYDVNFATCYYTPDVPYPQGGRLNRAVNLPSQYLAQAGSGLDRLKMEALSWGSTYRNFANAQAAIAFPVTAPASWPMTATAYLVPWFNGRCPWVMEFLYAARQSLPLTCFWAVDHLCLLDWPLLLPKDTARRSFL
jgi:hypothetical protein